MKRNAIRSAGIVALAVGLALGASSRVLAGPGITCDAFETSYFDVATSALASRAGYGGSGISGGSGDNTVRIINPTSANVIAVTGAGLTTASNGTVCAMIYVFDDFEEMQTCCGCPVTSDGMRTLSVVNDLTFNFGVNRANLNAGVIEIVSSAPNFELVSPPPGPNPPGTNFFCSPTGIASSDPFWRAYPVDPIRALRASITHDELMEPGSIPGGKPVQSVSVDEFQGSPLDETHLDDLQSRCNFLISNGSGTGVCTCGVGEDVAATGSTASR